MICLYLVYLFLRCIGPEALQAATTEDLTAIAIFISCDIELLRLVQLEQIVLENWKTGGCDDYKEMEER